MKRIFLFLTLLCVMSCSEESPLFRTTTFPIDEAITPARFTYRTSDTIVLKYTLPNSCFYFKELYYSKERNTRVVAIDGIEDLASACSQENIEKEIRLPIHILQEKDYVFKFYKGKDTEGNAIFDEIVVPVD